MKKILTIILSMALLLSAASVISYAEEPTAVDNTALYTTRITATTVTHTVKYIPDNGKELSIKININSSRPVYINIYKDDEPVIDHRYTNGNDSYIYTYSSADNKPCEFKIRISDITNDGSPVDAGFAFYADEYRTNNIETLEKYGIIQGDDNEELKLNNFITRSEVATVVCKLLCLDLTDEKSCFTDVTDDFWGKNYINTAHKYNIIHGYENMCFKPNQNITYAETSKVIVSCLGYAPIAEKNGGYPSGYTAIARDLGLITNTSYNPDEFVMRKDVFDMIYNSLDIPIAIEENYGEKKNFDNGW